ncbi:MAG: glucose-1-phosphate adenylyltransferase subunit GlgD [Ruminococcaceae bacterium]|nr:glucose-1-phosphate adenylyltransferase subunit GlgD [Oscillospiraceae bacterium]
MKAMGVVFSNIYDSSLGELTNYRTVSSLPFGGRYRQIDFVLSNMSNSGIYNIGLITKYNYRSLMDHLGSCTEWDLNRKNEGLVILPPFASGHTGVYKGKLEALYSAVSFIDNSNYDYVVVSDSTVLCNINLRDAIEQHVASGVDVTAVCNKEKADGKKHPLILNANSKGNATSLLIDSEAEKGSLVGMGMFIFGREMLVAAIKECYAKGYVHLERDFIQRAFNEKRIKVGTYKFDGVVLRNEDIKSYYHNNMKLLDEKVRKGLFLKDAPIYTKVRDEIPTYYGKGSKVCDCLLADGCTLQGNAKRSIMFRGVTVGEGAEVQESIVMQGTKIGKGAKLKCVILDKNVTVSDGAVLIGTPEHPVIVKKGETV